MSDFYFKKPKLRSNANIKESNDSITISCNGADFYITNDEGNSLDNIKLFLELLNGEEYLEGIVKKSMDIGLTKEQVMEYVEILDESFLLDEGNIEEGNNYSGIKFITKLEDLFHQWQHAHGETKLSSMFIDGEASLNLITGWTIEYHYITNRAHDCISPAINRAHGEFQDMLIDFFHEEYRHDKMILKSLETLNINKDTLAQTLPLPFTAAVANLLSKWAHTDLLSFYAALFIFEGTAEEGNGYIEALSQYDLPKGFIKPQAAHNTINVEGDHGNVSRDFYSKIDHVNKDDQLRVIKNMRILHETQLKQYDEIIENYDLPGDINLRYFNKPVIIK